MADQLKSRSKAESSDGRLPLRDWSAVLDLYDACLKNAEQLLDEADLLLSHAHHARALALALVAYEEIGKSQIVADYYNNMVSKKEFREAFVKHEIKSAYNSRQFHVTTMDPFEASIVYDKGKAKQYSQYRMASLYVDCTEDYKSLIPSEVVTPEDATAAIAACRKNIKHIKVMSRITERIGSESFTK
jgi:AbiV family abortive infection protein